MPTAVVAILSIVGVVEVFYWFVIFPKMWRDGSNREIEDIKVVMKNVYGIGPGAREDNDL